MDRLKRAKDALFNRYYEGASFSKDNRHWNMVTRTSPNVENRTAGPILSNRARSLLRDSPYANRALTAIVHNTVGAGILPQIRTPNESAKSDLMDLWKEWAETPAIDIEGRKDFYAIQAQVLRTIVSDGECLIRIVKSSVIPSQFVIVKATFMIYSSSHTY